MVKADTTPLVVLPPHISRSRGEKNKDLGNVFGESPYRAVVSNNGRDDMALRFHVCRLNLYNTIFVEKIYHYLKRDLSRNYHTFYMLFETTGLI